MEGIFTESHYSDFTLANMLPVSSDMCGVRIMTALAEKLQTSV